MKSIVIYQAYGPRTILEQNLFSVVSLLKHHPDFSQVEKIVIYTDDQGYFDSFLGPHPRVEYKPIHPARLTQWRGSIQFVHRVKIEMLRDVATQFSDFNLFYLDGDTYFMKDPNPLMGQINMHHSVMHEAENIVNQGKDPLSKKVARFLAQFEFNVEGKKIKIPPSMVMWNAGVLGFSPKFFETLKCVLELTDQSYAKYKKHVMEQMAFSYFLAATSRIHSAAEYVHHYWRQKEDFSELIQNFLMQHKNLTQALTAFDQIRWPLPPPPKETFFQRFLRKLKP